MPSVSICRRDTGDYSTANLCQVLLHDLGTVVHRENDIRDTSGSEGLNLVENHTLVTELDQRFGQSKGLIMLSVEPSYHRRAGSSNMQGRDDARVA